MTKLILVFISLVSFSTFAGSKTSHEVTDCTVASLIMGINSDNFGLRTSAAYMLGELQCEEGVIPLMQILKSGDREDARIVAALALLKIGNAKGIFAIKQAIRFDESERVSRLCSYFYHAHSVTPTMSDFLAHK